MQIVDSAVMQPGACYLTGRDVGPFIDTNLDVDGLAFGRVYIAVSTVEDLSGLIGMVTPAVAGRIARERAEARQTVAEQAELIEQLKSAIGALKQVGYTEEVEMPRMPTPSDIKRAQQVAAMVAETADAAKPEAEAEAAAEAETKPAKAGKAAKKADA